MGIVNIHLLMNEDSGRHAQQAREALEAKLIADHRQGKHPWGQMRRECPYCQSEK